MSERPHRLSVFSRSLDQVAFVAYLLGAIVPLVVLAWVVQSYVLPHLEETRAAAGMVGLLLSIAALSLASFLALRRMAAGSLARMEEDNRVLSAMLDAAGRLSEAVHPPEAARIFARSARMLTSARAAWVVSRDRQGEDFKLLAHEGEEAEATYASAQARIDALAAEAIEVTATVPGTVPDTPGGGAQRLVALPIQTQDRSALALVVASSEGRGAASDGELRALATLCGLGAIALQNANLHEGQRNFFVHLTDMLLSALDVHLDYHQGHARRVAELAYRIGRQMDFDDDRLERLHFAALLHDIGMLKIPLKRHGDLVTLRKHPSIGHRMLSSIRIWEDLAPIILHHHEWYDGTGYPQGIAGEEIPLESRIIALAEAVDSMNSDTSYRDKRSPESTLQEVEAGSGLQFDPEVARIFLELVRGGDITLE